MARIVSLAEYAIIGIAAGVIKLNDEDGIGYLWTSGLYIERLGVTTI